MTNNLNAITFSVSDFPSVRFVEKTMRELREALNKENREGRGKWNAGMEYMIVGNDVNNGTSFLLRIYYPTSNKYNVNRGRRNYKDVSILGEIGKYTKKEIDIKEFVSSEIKKRVKGGEIQILEKDFKGSKYVYSFDYGKFITSRFTQVINREAMNYVPGIIRRAEVKILRDLERELKKLPYNLNLVVDSEEEFIFTFEEKFPIPFRYYTSGSKRGYKDYFKEEKERLNKLMEGEYDDLIEEVIRENLNKTIYYLRKKNQKKEDFIEVLVDVDEKYKHKIEEFVNKDYFKRFKVKEDEHTFGVYVAYPYKVSVKDDIDLPFKEYALDITCDLVKECLVYEEGMTGVEVTIFDDWANITLVRSELGIIEVNKRYNV